jgi:LEA14-like dessication related protein
MPAFIVHPARWLLLVALTLTVAACASVSSLEAPEVRVTGLTMLEAEPGSMEQRFLVSLRLTNPNNRAIVIDGLDFELDVNDRRLARGVTAERFELPRLGEADTSVVVTTSLFDVLRQVMTLGSKRDGGLDYRLRGRLHLGSGLVRTIPFDHRGQVTP